MKNQRILLRADASPQIGAGHVMRSLALGQLLMDEGHEVHFGTIPDHPAIVDLLKQQGFKVHCMQQPDRLDAASDLYAFLGLAKGIQPSWVVLDGYHFDNDYERQVKRSGYKLLRIDDIPSGHYYADVVLNQNYGAETFVYEKEPYTQVLAGLRHVLLRREFRKIGLADKKINQGGPWHIMVSLGGSSTKTDELNFKIVQGLSSLCGEDHSITLLAGKMGDGIKNFTDNNMAEEMSKADLAIVSGGSTMWELVYMRVPFLAVSLNDRQREYIRTISLQGLCVELGRHEDLTPDLVDQRVRDLMGNLQKRGKMIEKYRSVMDKNHMGRDLLAVLSR